MSGSATPLHLAGVYRRSVRADLARIWENVFDWEHLPALHEGTFAAVDLIEAGDWGWRVKLTAQPGDPARAQTLALAAEPAIGRYVVTTEAGPGRGSEIRVRLAPRAPTRTDVTVEFHVPEADAARLALIGARYVEVYARLWDEDEAMMRARHRALAARAMPGPGRPRRLGTEGDVRARAPFPVTFGGVRFRVVEVAGRLLAHAVTCPHWLGPLGEAPVSPAGQVRCPWHGYLFDVATGASADGRALRLARPPRVTVEAGEVWLRPACPTGPDQ